MIPNPMFIYPRETALLRWSDKCINLVTMVEWSNTIDLRSISLWRAQVRTLLVTNALLAQSAEHQTLNLRVAGSSPARG